MRPHEITDLPPGLRLRVAREALGISLREMERQNPRLDRGKVSRIERGERPLSVSTLVDIAQVLGMRELVRVLRPFCDDRDSAR